jgi:hypothetical protein
MLAYCRANPGKIRYVVVFDLSRFARNVADQGMAIAELARCVAPPNSPWAEVGRLQWRRMIWSGVAIIAMRNLPGFVATSQCIERCPLLSASRSFCDAGKNGAGPVDVVLYPGRCVDDFRGEEHRVDRLGTLILLGVAIMVLGIAVSARAGLQRERNSPSTGPSGRYGLAVVVAVLCGLMAPMLNYAFAFGQSIAGEAARQGTSREAAGYAIWPIALMGGLVPNAAYSLWLLKRNRSWKCFRGPWFPEVWLGCWMAAFWMGALAIYGVSSVYLGVLGTSVGWALFQIFMIMTANLSGVLTGEWKCSPRSAQRGLWTGLGLLAVATAVIAAGNR